MIGDLKANFDGFVVRIYIYIYTYLEPRTHLTFGCSKTEVTQVQGRAILYVFGYYTYLYQHPHCHHQPRVGSSPFQPPFRRAARSRAIGSNVDSGLTIPPHEEVS